MIRKKHSRRLNIRHLACQMEWRRNHVLGVHLLLVFEFPHVFELTQTNEYGLDGFFRERGNQLSAILLDGHGERSFEFQV